MTRSIALACLLACAGCAERDEVIAVVDPPGQGGGGAGPILTLASSRPLVCGDGTHMVTGELDGDGDADVLVAGGCLDLLRGSSGATLAPAEEAVPAFGQTVALGGIDAHPALDAVGYGELVRVFAGDGAGGFQHLHDLTAAGPGAPGRLALGDLGGDPALDLVTSAGTELSVWLGDGAGAFGPAHTADVFHEVHGHAVGRFAGSSWDDVVIANGAVAVLVSSGDASLSAPHPAELQAPEAVRALLAADLDGDGCDDVVALDGTPLAPAPAGGLLRILRNACDDSGSLVEVHAVAMPRAVHAAAGDLDGDGTLDAVVALAAPAGGVAVLRGLGDGALAPPELVALEGDPRSLALADFDQDGRLDVAVSSGAPARVDVLVSP